MKLLPLILSITIGFSIIACKEEKRAIAEELIAQDFHEIQKKTNGMIIDVRTNQEVNNGMIAGAIQIDFYRKDFYEEIDRIDRKQPVFLYCAAGGRSSFVLDEMASMGFKEVYSLIGGYNAWLDANYSTIKPDWSKE